MNRRKIAAYVGAAIALTLLGGVSACDERTPKEHTVVILGFEFVPNVLNASVGDTITWVNEDIVPHTASGKDGAWDTGTIMQGESKSVTVTDSMTSSYFCRFHVNMVGSVVLDR